MNKSVPSVSVKYAANGSSNKSNELDMRAMQNAALASRVIRATLVAGLIRKADADRPRPCCICTGMGVTWKTFDRVLIAQTQTRGGDLESNDKSNRYVGHGAALLFDWVLRARPQARGSALIRKKTT